MKATELLGRAVGWAASPGFAVGSVIRRSRILHPDGVVHRAEVTPLVTEGPLGAVAERLRGAALVRHSSAWWKGGKEWLDVLGIAVRFLDRPVITEAPAPGDQDLLFATIRFPWTTPFAPLATNPHSFLWNNYHGVSPFLVPELGRVKLRLVSPHLKGLGETRLADLETAVALGVAVYELQVRRQRWGARFEPLVAIRLVAPVDLDQEALRFWPFRAGKGIAPQGFVHALRAGAYRASQWARPSSQKERG
jgi:hypothetical protein